MSFAHACEHCGTRQLLTDSEFDALGGQFKCDDCKGIQQKTTIERKTKQFKAARQAAPTEVDDRIGLIVEQANAWEDDGEPIVEGETTVRYSMHVHGREQAA